MFQKQEEASQTVITVRYLALDGASHIPSESEISLRHSDVGRPPIRSRVRHSPANIWLDGNQ